jgi:hypothetical protein
MVAGMAQRRKGRRLRTAPNLLRDGGKNQIQQKIGQWHACVLPQCFGV